MPPSIEVLITLPISDDLLQPLRGMSTRLKVTMIRAKKVEDIPPEIWNRTEVLYTNRIIPTPEQAPQLRWIQLHFAGADHILDHPILKKPDLVVTTLSGTNSVQMAEYAMMMLLALGHRLPDLMANQRKAEWPSDRWERFSPLELRNSTVGIVGYGSIGRQIARLLQEFGATVLATKRDVMHPEDRGYSPEGQGDPGGDLVHRLYPPQAICSMFKECDFVIITLPLTYDTRHLIGPTELAALHPQSYLVDISRGSVIDHAALIQALRDHKIAGVALDVFPEEPLPADSPLWKMSNVILTPHIGGVTPHYDRRAMLFFIENLHRYLSGLPLYNYFDPERGY